MTNCLICNGSTSTAFRITVRHEHMATYLRCQSCEFIFVEDPFWLHASFGGTLQHVDVGSVDRNLLAAQVLKTAITTLNIKDGVFVDWGGGYGLLSRIMRDSGFNYHNQESFVTPLFYSPEVPPGTEKYSLISVIEVILHYTQPLEEFRALLEKTDRLFFTTTISPSKIDSNWWYLMPDTGQHVALYTKKSLEILAHILGVKFVSDEKFFHMFYRGSIPTFTKLIFRSRIMCFAYAQFLSLRQLYKRSRGGTVSLIDNDHKFTLAKEME